MYTSKNRLFLFQAANFVKALMEFGKLFIVLKRWISRPETLEKQCFVKEYVNKGDLC